MSASAITILILIVIGGALSVTICILAKKLKKESWRSEALEDLLNRAHQENAAMKRMYDERAKHQEKANNEKDIIDLTPNSGLVDAANNLFGVPIVPTLDTTPKRD